MKSVGLNHFNTLYKMNIEIGCGQLLLFFFKGYINSVAMLQESPLPVLPSRAKPMNSQEFKIPNK